MSDKISVFGASGFIGGEFCRQFAEQVIRIPKEERVPYSPRVITFVSTTDNYNVFDNPTLDIETNLIHLTEVLDASYKKYGKGLDFTFVSSWFVFGKTLSTEFQSLTEESLCRPTGFYSLTKKCAEDLLISYCETFGIKYRVVRLANVLGHRDMKVSKKKNALQFLLDRLVHNEDIELYNGGNFYRDYVDVRDCARAIKLVMDTGTEPIYNISNGKSYLFKDLIDIAVKYSGSKSNVWDKMEIPSFHTVVQSKDVFISNEKLAGLGYSPEYAIEQTIQKIIDDYAGR